jgi:signal transduction histidine kinase/DNA-binding response OmpR family regulator
MEPSTVLAGATIVLVDDNPANLGVLTHALTAHGCRVLVAQHGDSGIEIARHARPDLILLDVRLPGMDGFEVCRRLKAEPATSSIPVLFMTAYGAAADKLRGFEAGGVDYITKPVEEAEVLARVTTHVRLGQLAQRLQAHNEDLERRVAERTAELVQANVELQAQIAERLRAEKALRANEEQLYAYTQRLQILHIIDRAILAAESPEAIAQAALDHMHTLIPWRWASVAMFDENLGDTVVLATHPDRPADAHSQGFRTLALQQVANTLRQGEVQVVDTVDRLSSPPPFISPAQATQTHSYVNVPLTAAGDLVGVLSLGAEQPRAFAPDHVAIAREVANEIAVAIRQARLYAAEQQARRLAETLRAANLAQTRTLDLDTILDTLLEYLRQLVPYDSAAAMVCDADARLTVRSVSGEARWGDARLGRGHALDIRSSPHLRALLATQTSILIRDTSGDRLDIQASAAEAHSWLGVPLITGGTVIGVYVLEKQEPGFFTEEHRQIAEALAAQAAVAMQNARLFAEVSAARARLQAVSRQLVAVQEAERRQIARDLHDEIGQTLTGLKLVLAIGTRGTPESVQARLVEAQGLVNDLTARVRELSLELRPAMLDDLGLLPTLLWHVKRYTAQTQIQVILKHSGLERRVDSDVEIAVYRIFQEGLTNVARHASTRELWARIWRTEEHIGVQIEDHGCGFAPEEVLATHTSSGLAGMVERARLLGGQLTIEAAPGRGTRLTAELPISAPLE